MARRFRLRRPLLWTAAGAAAAYFWDPENGRSRRTRLSEQLRARARSARDDVEQKARYVQSTAEGKVQSVRQADRTPPADDRTLVDKIKSEVLGQPQFESHQVLVEAAEGVVTLRGEAPDAQQIKELVTAVEKVPGVTSVQNLVHLPGEPPPNKQASLQASGP